MEKYWKAAAVTLVLLCLILCSSATPARADSEGAGTVTASALNMRSEPSTSSSVVTCLPRGTVVVLTGKTDGWYKVAYKGHTGYMSSDYLSVSSSADASLGDGTVTGNLVNIRSGPSTSNSVIGSRNKGDTLSVTGVSDNWYKVSLNGSTGYIRSDYLNLGSGSGTSPSSGSSSGSSASGTGTINASYVRMRSGPSTSHSILGTYNSGTKMSVNGDDGDWYKVTYNGTDGYVYKTYLTVGGSSSSSSSGVTDMSDTSATVISPVHFRKGPDTSYSSMQVLSSGTSVTITGQTAKWYRVRYNGTEGYVFKTYLSTGSTAVSSSSSSAGSRIVSKAKEYLGVPYVYGGTSPSGFDCSGFVYYVYQQCGYTITRTATTQNGNGRQVSRSDLQPGDIIIFYNSAKTAIGHSAIYIGNGQFIHASSSGGRVMITNLSSTYYDTHFYSARRIVS